LALNSGLADLLSKVRARRFRKILLEETVTAASLALASLILLLALGTEILQWYWPLVLLGGGLAVGVWRGRKRIPSSYRLLQEVDRRLELHDGLSTAFIFTQSEHWRRGSERVRAAQRAEAEALSRQVDPRRAMPVEAPRGVYVAVLLAVAAGTLFAARYGVQRSLDLRPPLSRALVDLFRFPAQAAKIAEPEAPSNQPDVGEVVAPPDKRQAGRAEHPTDPANGMPPGDLASAARNGEAPGDELRDGARGSDQQERESSRNGAERSQGEESSPSPPAPEAPSKEADSRPAPSKEQSDLIRKLQDAFANLLAKLKIPPMAGEGRRTSERGTSEGSKTERGEGQKGEQAAGNPDGEGTPVADPRGHRTGESAQQAQAGKGEGADQRSDQPGSDQAQSGIGTKDGAKSLRAQEQLEAMGRLSEILGKRAENITGEVMIEVSSGDQTLQTPYADRHAGHREAGGEIHRDQVPLIYQEYVQRYFEQVRKAANQ
jgi:hypothetical protein